MRHTDPESVVSAAVETRVGGPLRPVYRGSPSKDEKLTLQVMA